MIVTSLTVEQACRLVRLEVKDLNFLKSLVAEDIVFNSIVVVHSWHDATYLWLCYLATNATN